MAGYVYGHITQHRMVTASGKRSSSDEGNKGDIARESAIIAQYTSSSDV